MKKQKINKMKKQKINEDSIEEIKTLIGGKTDTATIEINEVVLKYSLDTIESYENDFLKILSDIFENNSNYAISNNEELLNSLRLLSFILNDMHKAKMEFIYNE